MKKLFAVIIGAFFLSLVQSAPSQALPDGRLSLSVNTSAVFMGTEAAMVRVMLNGKVYFQQKLVIP